uniref:Fasciculation and elongation protein zeta-2 n=2 Tax=Acrobeloides nanus TaxID=290746 RepID=A0A914CAI3_9BILA
MVVAVTKELTMEAKDLAIPDAPLAVGEDVGSFKESPILKAEKLFADCPSASNNDDANSSSLSGSLEENAHLSTSLEDLVENFDLKINKVLTDFDEDTDHMAPVQIRTQDEIMSESQVWWTLTGNYGNILPLDFSKTQIRKNQIEALNLQSPRDESSSDAGYDQAEEEELRQSMDLHQLISQQVHISGESPPISADQVIEEIDEIMQTGDLIRSMTTTDRTIESVDSMYSSMRSPYESSHAEVDMKLKSNAALDVTPEELSSLPQSKLLTLFSEMEQLIQLYNAELVTELAHRDELEYEKEVKNKFITLLVQIQDKRRKYQNERKKKSIKLDISQMPQYMTASIPFEDNLRMLDVPMLEALIKILQAINEDSPQVPSLLTDYILTVVCPSPATTSTLDNL